ncbi:MAG: nucleoside deaminase [Muribaculaceae bacterium]|nr:nucleoside deaminase [Muribaculaceae bacterium]
MQSQEEKDERFMRMALAEAMGAADAGEIPVGAVITVNDRIIARGHNLTETLNDVTAHAEMIAITSAAENLGGKYLPECTLYVTVEPCAMCAGALGWSQIGRIVYGASDKKRGFFSYFRPDRSPIHPKTRVSGGVLEEECRLLMQDFFKKLRR